MNSGDPIQSACQAARENLVQHVGPVGQGSQVERPSQGFHCDACQSWFERACAQARAMNLLERQVAEFSALDGLVVAGLNAGYRQERAAAALASLKRLDAPSELDGRVAERFGRMIRGAPDELELRVASELAGGAGLRAQRQLSSLARLAAPAELEVRVIRDLSRSLRSESLPLRRWIAIAATLIIAVGAASLARQGGLFGTKKHYEFRVEHTSLASLDPGALNALTGFSGIVLAGDQR